MNSNNFAEDLIKIYTELFLDNINMEVMPKSFVDQIDCKTTSILLYSRRSFNSPICKSAIFNHDVNAASKCGVCPKSFNENNPIYKIEDINKDDIYQVNKKFQIELSNKISYNGDEIIQIIQLLDKYFLNTFIVVAKGLSISDNIYIPKLFMYDVISETFNNVPKLNDLFRALYNNYYESYIGISDDNKTYTTKYNTEYNDLYELTHPDYVRMAIDDARLQLESQKKESEDKLVNQAYKSKISSSHSLLYIIILFVFIVYYLSYSSTNINYPRDIRAQPSS